MAELVAELIKVGSPQIVWGYSVTLTMKILALYFSAIKIAY
jgi:hypothetical protein